MKISSVYAFLSMLAAIPVILFMVRTIIMLPFAMANAAADDSGRFKNQWEGTLFYLFNIDKLKRVYIDDGKLTYRPPLKLATPGAACSDTATRVTLRRIAEGNPFEDHPHLRSIWHAGLQEHVEADTVNDLKLGSDDPAENLVYLICDSATAAVVGITGLYSIGQSDLGLRWHGVIPACRSLGLSAEAFQCLTQVARQERPTKVRIVEYIELCDAHAAQIQRHFVKLGFACAGAPQDATEHPAECALPANSGAWQAMEYSL